MHEFLTKAVALSRESFQQGRFPAGAVLVKDGKVIDMGLSGLFPHIHMHAETKVIDNTMKIYNAQLEGFELVTSMEPCMMCLGKAYWAGIRKITYVLAKEDVNQDLAYETSIPTATIQESLNGGMVLIQDRSLHTEALEIYKLWERTQVA